MQDFINFVDKYMLEIIVSSVSFLVLVFLVRSFRRSLLIEKGQARFVLERFDAGTEKLNKWVTFIILFMLVPLFIYTKFLHQ